MNANFNPFPRHGSTLYAEQVPLETLIQAVGTPCYVYSATQLINQYQAFKQAFASHPTQICFAVKSNSNLAILQLLAQQAAGFDIVSGGELTRVITAGGDPHRVVFSGIGKTAEELRYALKENIGCFNVESGAELDLLLTIAQQENRQAPIALRINPNVDPQSHPYISTGLKSHKFGIPLSDAMRLYQQAAQHPHAHIVGVACHIGSQIMALSPFEEAFSTLFRFAEELEASGIPLRHVNIGGGLGVCYDEENQTAPPRIADYAALALRFCPPHLTLLCEPGRAIAAQAGILVTQLLYLKSVGDKDFCVVDAGMNDLIRPALYGAYQAIEPLILREGAAKPYDIVGPVCESSDYLGKDRLLSVQMGDCLAVFGAGAYGFTMSSQYNSRPRAAEVLVQQQQYKIVRRRETIADLLAMESPFL